MTNKATTPPLTGAELDKLEALARAATPGEWTACPFGRLVGGPLRHYTNGSTQSQIASFNVTFHDQAPDDEPERQQANTEFVAAFSPPTALALIAQARAQQETAAAPAEEQVRFCPHCGSIGEVEATFRDCCPDGGAARYVPRKLAEVCRDTFKLAIDAASQPPAPVVAADERARQIMFAAYSRCIGDDKLSPDQIADVLLSAAPRAAAPDAAHADYDATVTLLRATVDLQAKKIAEYEAAHAQQDAAPADLIANVIMKLMGARVLDWSEDGENESSGFVSAEHERDYVIDCIRKHAPTAVAPSDATGKVDAANAGGVQAIYPPEFPSFNPAGLEGSMSPSDLWEYACLVGYRCAATSAADAKDAEPVTYMTEKQGEDWAWAQVRRDVGTAGWTAGDHGNYYGFFLWGWRYRAQYERQRAAIAAQQAAPVAKDEEQPLGICCYGGPLKPKSDCASCAAWQPKVTQQTQSSAKGGDAVGGENDAR